MLLLHTLFDQSLGSAGIFLLMKTGSGKNALQHLRQFSLCSLLLTHFGVVKIDIDGLFFPFSVIAPCVLSKRDVFPSACHQIPQLLLN